MSSCSSTPESCWHPSARSCSLGVTLCAPGPWTCPGGPELRGHSCKKQLPAVSSVLLLSLSCCSRREGSALGPGDPRAVGWLQVGIRGVWQQWHWHRAGDSPQQEPRVGHTCGLHLPRALPAPGAVALGTGLCPGLGGWHSPCSPARGSSPVPGRQLSLPFQHPGRLGSTAGTWHRQLPGAPSHFWGVPLAAKCWVS